MLVGIQKIETIKEEYLNHVCVDLDTLSTQAINKVRNITAGNMDPAKLPPQFESAITGSVQAVNRATAAKVLQVVDMERSYLPIMSWLTEMTEDTSKRHWADTQQVLSRIDLFSQFDVFNDRLSTQAIPFLEVLATDTYEPDHKAYPEYAVDIIANIGGPNAKRALTALSSCYAVSPYVCETLGEFFSKYDNSKN